MAQLTTERFADLFCAIGNSSNVCGNLAHGRRILREPLICPTVSILSFRNIQEIARTHLSHKFVANSPYVIVRKIKLRGHALGLCKKGHLVWSRDRCLS
jgi:hypothetical protein